jgi:hypothetical protein
VKTEKAGELILAGLAHNAAELLGQYNELAASLPSGDRYDVTLHLSVLQLLVTNGVEYARTLSNTDRKAWIGPLDDVLMPVVAEHDAVVEDTFPEDLDALEVLTRVRNALSHPRMKVNKPPTTGYSTRSESDSNPEISHVTLTDSPDLNSRGTPRRAEDRPKYRGRPYEGPVRVFTLRLTADQLFDLTKSLADRLSDPVAPLIHGEFPTEKVQTLELAG